MYPEQYFQSNQSMEKMLPMIRRGGGGGGEKTSTQAGRLID